MHSTEVREDLNLLEIQEWFTDMYSVNDNLLGASQEEFGNSTKWDNGRKQRGYDHKRKFIEQKKEMFAECSLKAWTVDN